MEKKFCSYETLFVVNGNYSEEEYKTVLEKFVTLVNDNATDVNVNEWGKRRLAYAINYVTEGYYVLLSFKSEPSFPIELDRVFGITEGYYVLVSFKSEPSFPLELERVLGITEGVIRYMTTTKIEKADAPVAAEAVAEAAEEATEANEATEA